MVASSSNASGPITIGENQYTETEYAVKATYNALAAGTYCFRVTDNGDALDGYDIFPVLTLEGVDNTAPFFITYPTDGGSATDTPTTYGFDVTFTANANDDEADDFYLAVCKTNSITAGNDTEPRCNGGAWCISELSTTTTGAMCATTTATALQSLPWYAFVCDKYPGFAVGKCSPASQGESTDANNSPFVINHLPVFTSATTTDNFKDPGEQFTITAYAYDNDDLGTPDFLKLYVCSTDSVTGSGCNPPANTICQATSTSPDVSCSFTDTAPTPAGDYTYYAFIFDSHNIEAANNSIVNTYKVNNVPPYFAGSTILNGGNPIQLNIKPSTTTVQAVNTSVVDLNGCDTGLVSAVAIIYMTATTTSCIEDDSECYHVENAQCVKSACAGDHQSIATYTCGADFRYFAKPTDDTDPNNPWKLYDWQAWLQVYDGYVYAATTSAGVELNTNVAFEVEEPLVHYGNDLYPGDNTGTRSATTTVINIGNAPIDTYVIGTDLTSGAYSILASYEKYSLNPNFNYTSTGTPLSSIEEKLVPILAPRAVSVFTTSSDEIFWGIGIPIGTYPQIYSGENTFRVMIDSSDW